MAMASFHKSFFIVFFALLSSSHAYTFTVGGKDGWTLHPSENYNEWSSRLRFIVNDTLHFKYNGTTDSVLEVDNGDYDNCNTDKPITILTGGESFVNLNRTGPFYFISGNKTNCDKGQKLKLVVITPKKKPQTPTAPPPATLPMVPTAPPVASPPKSGTSEPTSPTASPGGGSSAPPMGSPAAAPGGGTSSSPMGSPAVSPSSGISSPPMGSSAASPGGGESSPMGSPASSTDGGISSPPFGNPAASPGGGAADVNAPGPGGPRPSSSARLAVSATSTVLVGMMIFGLTNLLC